MPTSHSVLRGVVLATTLTAALLGGARTGATAVPASPRTLATASTTHRIPSAVTSRPARVERPNVVLITTDDEAMSDMAWMPRTRRLLGEAGITFRDSISPHPLCCPARAEILTGQYAQNNGVRSNEAADHGGFRYLDSNDTIATWLSAARYHTAFVGKYLNGYHAAKDGREPGWDIWNPTMTNVYGYFDYTMYNNGNPRHYGNLHNADLVGQKTVAYIRKFSRSDAPFFIWASHVAPHGACLPSDELSCGAPPVPAARHAHLFSAAQSPSLQDPAFNEADMSDKPSAMQRLRLRTVSSVNRNFRARIRALQAVDEADAATIRALRDTGELANTIVAMTSDNGFLLGEHRKMSKNVPYEQALKVPLLVRGPGIPAGETRDQTVATIDLAPTLLDVANARATLPVDGRSLLPFLADSALPGLETALIQAGPVTAAERTVGWSWRGVRTARYTYVSHPATAEHELYDRLLDPAELENVSGRPEYAPVQAEMARRLEVLGPCSGPDCRQTFGADPEPLSTPETPAGG